MLEVIDNYTCAIRVGLDILEKTTVVNRRSSKPREFCQCQDFE